MTGPQNPLADDGKLIGPLRLAQWMKCSKSRQCVQKSSFLPPIASDKTRGLATYAELASNLSQDRLGRLVAHHEV